MGGCRGVGERRWAGAGGGGWSRGLGAIVNKNQETDSSAELNSSRQRLGF